LLKNMPMKQHRGFVIPSGSLPPTIQESGGGDESVLAPRPDSVPQTIDDGWSLASEPDADERLEQVRILASRGSVYLYLIFT
jgi:hypothetical protein